MISAKITRSASPAGSEEPAEN